MRLIPFLFASLLAAQALDSPLAQVHRVYVDKLGDEDDSEHLRDMVIASLQNSHLFIVTEDKEKADATLKGSATADTFKETRIHSEGSHNGRNASQSQTVFSGGAYSGRAQSSASSGLNSTSNLSDHTEERKHEASASVRLVLKNGDVVWSTTKESLGAKYRGAGADVADKISKQLVADWERARAWRYSSSGSPGTN
jgi:hypothetical protein